MKQILLILMVVISQSALVASQTEIVDKAIRDGEIDKDGEVTSIHLEKRKSTKGSGKISDAGLRILADRAPNVKFLYLGGTRITNAGLTHVAELKNLSVLSLDECQEISDEGLKNLYRCNSLKELRVRGTGVTQGGVNELKKQLGPKCKIHNNPKK